MPIIDPMISLAFSMYSGKGTYALLLGSGISKAAGIPTGWDIVCDLIRKIAKHEGVPCEPDPVSWYTRTKGEAPEYSKLLESIAGTPTERRSLLHQYFEPTPEERSEGKKAPTKAHRAIAELVRNGFVRVIITTNFDRLLEDALHDLGVRPEVISTLDQLSGSQPLIHTNATIIKIHGDYLDPRIRNTDGELAEYEPAFNTLLDRIFDDFGLIICGWSATWDKALSSAIERNPSRRYTSYWMDVKPLLGPAKYLLERKQYVFVQGDGADNFFETLGNKVTAMSDIHAHTSPLSKSIAVSTIKRYLASPKENRIRLYDLVQEETDRVCKNIEDTKWAQADSIDIESAGKLITQCDAHYDTLVAMYVTGCLWDDGSQSEIWGRTFRRCFDNLLRKGNGPGDIRLYPLMLLQYAIGISCVIRDDYTSLASSINKTAKIYFGNEKLICLLLNPFKCWKYTWNRLLDEGDNAKYHTPCSDYLHKRIKSLTNDIISSDNEYDAAFEKMEYIICLNYWHQNVTTSKWSYWGNFIYKNRSSDINKWTPNAVTTEIKEQGTNWAPLRAGFFKGDTQIAQTCAEEYNAFLNSIRIY